MAVMVVASTALWMDNTVGGRISAA